MKTQYITPTLRVRDTGFARNFLVSGNGENTNPKQGGWDYDWDETNN